MNSDLKKIQLGASADIAINNKIWFSSFEFNGLYCYDVETKKLEYIAKFEGVSASQSFLHGDAFLDDNQNIIFIPIKDRYIRIVDTVGKCVVSYKLSALNDKETIWGGTKLNNELVLFTSGYRIFFFDLTRKKLSKIKDISDYKWDAGFHNDIFRDALFTRNELFLMLGNINTSSIIQIGLNDDSYKKIELKNIAGTVTSISKVDNSYWILTSDSTDVIEWDGKDHYITYKNEEVRWMDNSTQRIIPYKKVISIGDDIWVIGFYADFFYRIKRDEKTVRCMVNSEEHTKISDNLGYGASYNNIHLLQDGRIAITPQRAGFLYILDSNGGIMERKALETSEYPAHELFENEIHGERMVQEKKWYGINTFIDYIRDEL